MLSTNAADFPASSGTPKRRREPDRQQRSRDGDADAKPWRGCRPCVQDPCTQTGRNQRAQIPWRPRNDQLPATRARHLTGGDPPLPQPSKTPVIRPITPLNRLLRRHHTSKLKDGERKRLRRGRDPFRPPGTPSARDRRQPLEFTERGQCSIRRSRPRLPNQRLVFRAATSEGIGGWSARSMP